MRDVFAASRFGVKQSEIGMQRNPVEAEQRLALGLSADELMAVLGGTRGLSTNCRR